jgi:hypothetical protein
MECDCVPDSISTWQSLLASCYEHCNELLGSIKSWKFLGYFGGEPTVQEELCSVELWQSVKWISEQSYLLGMDYIICSFTL